MSSLSLSTLAPLAIGLQAVAEPVQQFADQCAPDLVPPVAEAVAEFDARVLPRSRPRSAAAGARRLPRGVPQYPIREDRKYGRFGAAVPRGGNAGGGGQPGWVLKCKDWQKDPNSYIYLTIQDTNWVRTAEAIGYPEWAHDPKYNTARAREPIFFDICAEIEKWLADKTKYEAISILRKYEVPRAPVLDMK